jgi:hypothetical protein
MISHADWERLELIGYQVFPAFEDDPGEVLELRNDTCGSTLGNRMSFGPEELEEGMMAELEAMGAESSKPGTMKRARSVAADNLRKNSLYYKR